MQTKTGEHSTGAGFEFAHLADRMTEGKKLAQDFAEMGERKAKRMIRRGLEAGEDCLDETTHCIKHNPWQSVGIAAGAGVLVGVLFGWTCSRVCK